VAVLKNIVLILWLVYDSPHLELCGKIQSGRIIAVEYHDHVLQNGGLLVEGFGRGQFEQGVHLLWRGEGIQERRKKKEEKSN
jgi:hypothetical protein